MKIKNLNEDVYKEWKPDLRFKHIQSVLDKALNRGKYINNELEEVLAALKKADEGGYTKEQKKFIRDKHQQMWAKNRNVSESKELNEDYDSVFDKVHQYIYDLIQDTVIDNLAIVTASAVKEYSADWLDDNNLISQTNRAVTNLADILTKGLMAGYPDDLDESIKLNEKQWKHQLSSGIELRNQINSDDLDKQGILDALDKCLYELKNILPEDDQYEVDDLLEEIEMIEVEDDDFEEHIDYILNELYDICDYNNIWIPLQ